MNNMTFIGLLLVGLVLSTAAAIWLDELAMKRGWPAFTGLGIITLYVGIAMIIIRAVL